MLSNERPFDPDTEASNGGTLPVKRSIDKSETSLNCVIEIRVTVTFAGDWILAEPVPVRRPGVWVIGVDDMDERGVASQIGRTKIGLKL